jgi:CYTH domain-containing protein
MNRSPLPPPRNADPIHDALVVLSSDGASRCEVQSESGEFQIRAERRLNGVPVKVAAPLTESQYTALRGFSADVLEAERTLEIERKWRPTSQRSLDALEDFVGTPLSSNLIQQGYLVVDTTEVRLRRQGPACFLTLKSSGGLIRREVEIELSVQQFDALWPATEGQRLEKVRSKYALTQPTGDSVVVEVDRFCGAHAPLVVVECEFGSSDAAQRFMVPDCFGVEVTESKEHKNKALVIHGVPLAPLSGISLPREF